MSLNCGTMGRADRRSRTGRLRPLWAACETLELRHLLSGPADPTIEVLSTTMSTALIRYSTPDGSRLILEEKGPGDDSYHKLSGLESTSGTHTCTISSLLRDSSYDFRIRADRDGQICYSQTTVQTLADSPSPGDHSLGVPSLSAPEDPYPFPNPNVQPAGVHVGYPAQPISRVRISYRWEGRPPSAGGPMWDMLDPIATPTAPYTGSGDQWFGFNAGWSYSVRGYSEGDSASVTSDWSAPYSTSASGTQASAPSGVTVQRLGDGTIQLSWQGAVGMPGTYEFLAGNYHSYRSGKVMYTNTAYLGTLDAGRWEMNVYKMDVGGLSPTPGTASIDVITAPTDFRACLGSAKNQVRLIWDDPNPVESGFRIERQEQGTGTWQSIATPGAGDQTFEDTLPSDYAGKTYEYRLFALGAGGLITTAVTTTGSGIALRTVDFAGQAIKRDKDASLYSGPEWSDANCDGTITGPAAFSNGTIEGPAEHVYPVSCARSTNSHNSLLSVTVGLPYSGTVGTNWLVRGDASGYTFPPAAISGGSSGVLNISTSAPEALPQAIRSTVVAITWKLSTDGGTSYFTVGQSNNRVYVTGAAASSAYETVLDIGCAAADGVNMRDDYLLSDQRTAVDHIWDKFAGLHVKRVDGTLMVYDPKQSGDTAATPLSRTDGRGQCSAWSDLFYWTLNAQGIGAAGRYINTLAPYDRFQVDDGEVQGTTLSSPDTRFGWHVVVEIGVYPDTIYDPSFGVVTTKTDARSVEEKWEDVHVIDLEVPELTPPWLGENLPGYQLEWMDWWL